MVLVGHKCQQDLQSYKYVASSDRGQVVIPRLLLKLRIEPDGYACLALYPGSLMFENEGTQNIHEDPLKSRRNASKESVRTTNTF